MGGVLPRPSRAGGGASGSLRLEIHVTPWMGRPARPVRPKHPTVASCAGSRMWQVPLTTEAAVGSSWIGANRVLGNLMFTKKVARIFFVALAISTAASSATANVWSQYEKLTHARCPSRHRELFQDDYDDLLTGFIGGLPAATQKSVSANFKYTGPCARENFGGSCEMYTYLIAFKRLHLLNEFSKYSCRHWTCDFAASCHTRGQ